MSTPTDPHASDPARADAPTTPPATRRARHHALPDHTPRSDRSPAGATDSTTPRDTSRAIDARSTAPTTGTSVAEPAAPTTAVAAGWGAWVGRRGPSSILLMLGSFLIVVLRTLWPTPVGLADNGDGIRYSCQLDLVPADPDATRYVDYAILNWAQGTTDDPCENYPSSQVWILKALSHLTELTGGAAGSLDLRWGILANAVIIAVLVGLFAFAVRRSLPVRLFTSVAVLFVLSDPTFTNYAGGVFGEFPGILGVSLLAIGAIYATTSGMGQLLGLALVGAGGFLAITSKTQGVTLLIPLAAFLLCTTLRRRPGRPTRPWSSPARLALALAGKIVPAALAFALILPAVWVLDNNPKGFQAINPWELISVGILGNSDDPASDLEEMGFPPELEQYAGDNVWVENSILNTPDWDANTHLMTYETAAKFFLKHPDRAIVIANNAGNDFLGTRPDYLGTYTQDSGRQPREYDFSPLTELIQPVQGIGIAPLLIAWAGISILAGFALRRSTPGSTRRAFANAALLMIGIAIIQFFTASFGEAIENTKHMVYGILAGALAPAFALTAILHRDTRPAPHDEATASTPRS